MSKQPEPTISSSSPKRPEEMTPEERVRSMQAFAEEQKYIQPGGGEIIPWNSASGEGGFNSVIFANPLQGPTSFKMATDGPKVSLPPPSYDTVTGTGGKAIEKEKGVGKLGKLFGKKREEDGKEVEGVTEGKK